MVKYPKLIDELPTQQGNSSFVFDDEIAQLDAYIEEHLKFHSPKKTSLIQGATLIVSVAYLATRLMASHKEALEVVLLELLLIVCAFALVARTLYVLSWGTKRKPYKGQYHHVIPQDKPISQFLWAIKQKAHKEQMTTLQMYFDGKTALHYRDVVNVATLLKQYRNMAF